MDLGTYDAILFDMDGTLLTSLQAVERAWSAWAERADVSAAEVLAYMHGRTAVDTISRFARPHMDIAAEVKWLDDLELRDTEGIRALAGAKDLLCSLRPNQWCVVTSANRAVALLRIAAAGLPRPVQLVSADDVRRGKPDPEGYLQGAAMLGVRASRCLVFEDTVAGARAGLAAGAQVILVAGDHDAADLPVLTRITRFDALSVRQDDQGIRISLADAEHSRSGGPGIHRSQGGRVSSP